MSIAIESGRGWAVTDELTDRLRALQRELEVKRRSHILHPLELRAMIEQASVLAAETGAARYEIMTAREQMDGGSLAEAWWALANALTLLQGALGLRGR
ncbi:MAG: hypothetical protein JOZ41_04965 [Chloroflexi bacterium]|nr:hypothetical protein [Chloroflexota bacterium]